MKDTFKDGQAPLEQEDQEPQLDTTPRCPNCNDIARPGDSEVRPDGYHTYCTLNWII